MLGTTFTGTCDDIVGINKLLVDLKGDRGLDVPLHIDAASGGFVWPFLYPDSEWDFRLEQVRSINVSGHKFGLVYPGIGWLIFREKSDLAEDLVFYENYLGKTDATFTLNFSTGASMVLAQYYNFVRYGREGYAYIMKAMQAERQGAGREAEGRGQLRADRRRRGAAAPGRLQARRGEELRRVRRRLAALRRARLDGPRLHAAPQRPGREDDAGAGQADAEPRAGRPARRRHRRGLRDAGEEGRRPPDRAQEDASPTPATEEAGDDAGRLTWLGHSTVLIELASVRLLTDPLLRGRVAHLRRLGGRPSVPDGIDGVLISHAHHDHLDPPSLRLLGPSTPIVLPRGAGGLLRRRGFREVTEIEAEEETEIEGVRVRATHAEHRPGRGPLAPRSPALGYLIGRDPADPSHWRAYFAGDTDLFDGMEGLASRLDVALLPVSGWGKRVPAGHLTPRRAAEAVKRLGPSLVVPIHWGTMAPAWFGGRREPDRSAPLEFEREVAKLDAAVRVAVLEPGTSCEF